MFDDPKKDLKWLENQLLAEDADPDADAGDDGISEEEDWLEDELKEARALMDNDYSHRESVLYDQEEEEGDDGLAVYSDLPPAPEVKKPKKEKGIGGLVFLACLETLGIVAVLLWWVLWLL